MTQSLVLSCVFVYTYVYMYIYMCVCGGVLFPPRAKIVGLGSAIELASRNLEKNMEHMQRIRDRLQESLLDGLPAELVRVHGDQQYRLPNTLRYVGLDPCL